MAGAERGVHEITPELIDLAADMVSFRTPSRHARAQPPDSARRRSRRGRRRGAHHHGHRRPAATPR
jgi:hypothetical protein